MADRTVSSPWLPAILVVPAGTLQAAPASVDITVGEATLVEVRILIPVGHNGLTGIAVEMSHSRILPFGKSTDWIIGNDERLMFDMDIDVSGKIQVVGYNLDQRTHSFYVLTHIRYSTPGPAGGIGGGVLVVPS